MANYWMLVADPAADRHCLLLMPIVILLDPSQSWRWQLHGPDEVVLAEGCQTYGTYSEAMESANEICHRLIDAPVEVRTVPEPARSTPRISAAYAEVCRALRERGLEAALAVLNRPIPHRYSAVYWMPHPDRLVNVAVFDKLGQPCPPWLQTVPYNHSFCQFAIRDGQFRTADSNSDPRLDGHMYQGVVNSYHAVPMTSSEGEVLGTLCHFDTESHPLADEDFELLRLFANAVVPYLPRIAVPSESEGGFSSGG
ncbi:MAG: GAF domain-containing protein [Alcaligenaceae bacterium]|nr:MAG: GAF domain-containing protein [Alcaligenaceae bacterium]